MLQEAVRCDFDNWKVWDNLLVISTDLGAFDESLRSFNRILDIKQTHSDDQAGIFVKVNQMFLLLICMQIRSKRDSYMKYLEMKKKQVRFFLTLD